jgi:hypothetical protein
MLLKQYITTPLHQDHPSPQLDLNHADESRITRLHHLLNVMMRILSTVSLVLLTSSTTTTTWAFIEPHEMQQVIDYFQDTFLAHGGQDFLLRLDRGEAIHEQDDEFRALNDIFGLDCLLESIRPDIESSPKTGAVPATAHKSAVLCLKAGGPDCADESKQITFVDQMNATGSEFRYVSENTGRPTNQQGVFW